MNAFVRSLASSTLLAGALALTAVACDRASPTPADSTIEPPCCDLPSEVDGWDNQVGAGHVYVVNRVAVAPAGVCDLPSGDCTQHPVPNALSSFGVANDELRRLLLSGESLMLYELSGLGPAYAGDDASLTVRLYEAHDADDPPNPLDDWKVPPGSDQCCRFRVSPTSLVGEPEPARFRAAASLVDGALATQAPIPFQISHPELSMRFEKVMLRGTLAPTLEELDVFFEAAVPINALAGQENPFCAVTSLACPEQPAGATLADLAFALAGHLDVDLDFDGLERVEDQDGDGIIDHCYDGCLGECTREEIPSTPELPCVLSPRMADGWSIVLQTTAVPATIVHDAP